VPKSVKPCSVIVLMDPAPEEINETMKLDKRVDLM
jgi:hypothetical protein